MEERRKKQVSRDESEGVKKMATEEARKLKALNENKNIMRDKELYKMAKIEKFDWYMGLLGREDVEPYLTKPNEYAVRAAEQRNLTELVLSVNAGPNLKHGIVKDAVFHITLICDKNTKRWSITAPDADIPTFKSVPQLIDYYQKNFIPLSKPYDDCVRLEFPCKRPRWLLKRRLIEYSPKDLLGSGNFCDVYRGKFKQNTEVAIKVCRSTSTNANDQKNSEEIDKEILAREALLKEGKLMQTVQHMNVIKFYGICCDKPPVMVIMELCPGGSLLNHLTKFKDAISIGERLKYSLDAAEGMMYLHEKNLIHRDLAARNCLISRFGQIKIADFGLSKLLGDIVPGSDMNTKAEIPLRWMAPESLKREPEFSEKTDVWAYGMMLFEIFGNGQKPWPDWEHKKIATYIRRVQMPSFPDRTPQQVRELVEKRIWILEPTKRADFFEISVALSMVADIFPCPEKEDTTLYGLPGVDLLTKEEIRMHKGEDDDECIIKKVEASAMVDVRKIPVNEHGVARERDVTIEENPMSPAAKRGVPFKRPPSTRKNRRAVAEHLRDTSQDQVSVEQITPDSKKRHSRAHKRKPATPTDSPKICAPIQKPSSRRK